MSEFDVLRAVSSQYNYPIIDLSNIEVDLRLHSSDEKFCMIISLYLLVLMKRS